MLLLDAISNATPPFLAERLSPLGVGAALTAWLVNLKPILYLPALVLLAIPIGSAVREALRGVRPAAWAGQGIRSGLLFAGLCALSIPSGLGSFGPTYAQISLRPFEEVREYFYRRTLTPYLAYYLHLGGESRYLVYSLFLAFLLVVLASSLLTTLSDELSVNSLECRWSKRAGWYLLELSVLTSGFAIFQLQTIGYPELLGYSLVLLAALVPMNAEARWCALGLSLLAHDGLCFSVLPVVLFCVPKNERLSGLVLLAVFVVAAFLPYRFDIHAALNSHSALIWPEVLANPILALTGVFMAYKYLWFVALFAMWLLVRERKTQGALAMAALLLCPSLMAITMNDTTRLVSGTGLGILLAVATVYRRRRFFPPLLLGVLGGLVVLNLLLPSYSIYMNHSDTGYGHEGIYHALDRIWHEVAWSFSGRHPR